MYKVKEFFRKFFTPTGLKGFRFMPFLLSLLLFIFEAYILFFPVNEILNKKPEKYISTNDYTKVYYNIEGDLDGGIVASGYKIENNIMSANDDDIKIYKHAYKETYVYYIFDVNGKVTSDTKDIINAYKEKYAGESVDKINASAILIYVNMIKGNTLDASIDLYHAKTIEEISTELENLHYSDIYNLEEKDAYVMLFENKKVYIEFPYENDYFNDSITYEDASLNGFKIEDTKNLQDFSQIFTVALGRRYAKNAGIVYLGNSLIYTIVFPLMLSLIVWLGLRKRGCLKRFREYYNVLAIVSIVPCSISFILAWFISSTSGLVYLALIAIYGLMMLYQVTSLKE